MRSLSLISAAAVAALFVAVVPASSQEAAAPPAHLSWVQGDVRIDHNGDESEAAAVNMPIVDGDRIVTGRAGRAEVMFPDGSSIAIDPDSDVEMIGTSRVRVVAGAIEHRAAAVPDPRSNSTQNLPPDLQSYGPDLDQNGSWEYEPQYGSVWYPTTVTADWRPYYDGYWYSAPQYGWTWVADARWVWPTHHYGRWGYARSRWFWIPGRSYAGAWVSWGTAADYVSWCPLGYDGRPVVALSVWWSSWGSGYRRGPDAWTVVRRDNFGSRAYSPRRYGIEPYRLAANTAFIEHRTPPSRDRRGSFSVGAGAGRPGGTAYSRQGTGDYRNDRQGPAYARQPRDRGDRTVIDRAPNSSGVAVPRSGYGDMGRREAYDGRRGVYGDRSRSADRPATSSAPTPAQPQPNGNDHPAYRPNYVPRDRSDAPRDRSDGPRDGGWRDREPRGGARPTERAPMPERAGPRTSAPRSSAPSAPRHSDSAPAPRDNGGAHARERSQNSQSHGTAARRPR